MSHSETVICQFRVKPGSEEKLIGLCREHEAVLRRLGLVTDEPTACFSGRDERDLPFLLKIFAWKSAEALDAARQHPEVADLWERMEPLCEPRDGRPSMEFPHVERIPL